MLFLFSNKRLEHVGRAVVCMCREKIQKAIAQLELNQASAVSDDKFFKCTNNKRRSKESIGQISALAFGQS